MPRAAGLQVRISGRSSALGCDRASARRRSIRMDERLFERLAPRIIVAAQCLVAATIPAHADAVSDFYKGKTLSLIAGFPPGGGYDTYVRVLARHFGRFIPGQPLAVASNMPGAGSLTAANHTYGKAPADG